MNIRSMKKIPVMILCAVFSVSLFAITSENTPVSMNARKKNNSIEIEFNIKKGFGIQKKGPHELAFFALKNNFNSKEDLAKAFPAEGKIVYEARPYKFAGKTAQDDEDYFSNVNAITIPVSNGGKTGVRAKIFYCSFKDSFCSVQTLTSIVE